MAETLNYCILQMQVYAELPHSVNAVTQQWAYQSHS